MGGVISIHLGLFLKVKDQGIEWEYFDRYNVKRFFGMPDIPDFLVWLPVYAGPCQPTPTNENAKTVYANYCLHVYVAIQLLMFDQHLTIITDMTKRYY